MVIDQINEELTESKQIADACKILAHRFLATVQGADFGTSLVERCCVGY